MNKRRWMLILLLLQVIMMAGCGENEKNNKQAEKMQKWKEEANLFGKESAEELYQAAS